MDTSLFDKAAKFAVEAHRGAERRGKGFPYIIHPMEAASIVATVTNDPEMLAAAILHDTVEDTDVTIEQIEELFGPRVARLVHVETAQKGASWRARREVQIERFRKADRDCQIVALGDKLSNLRAIALDYHELGDALWSRFHAPQGKKDIEWYYRSLAAALDKLADTAPHQEFISLVESTFKG
ncbi:MAG: HD domain-containing protein [Bacteroidales bacterium]|nr:HD domain-containing protein [Bacteroidales bacterium]